MKKIVFILISIVAINICYADTALQPTKSFWHKIFHPFEKKKGKVGCAPKKSTKKQKKLDRGKTHKKK